MPDFRRLLSDHSVPWDDAHHHSTEGWIQVCCPFCAPKDTGFHLGVSEDSGTCNCWICGPHGLYDTLRQLGVSRPGDALRDAGWSPRRQAPKERSSLPALEMPSTFGALDGIYARYLESRGYDPKLLESVWGLKSGGVAGPMKFRIVIPVWAQGRLVTWQGRDVTGRSELRYSGLPSKDSILTTKEVVYGIDKAKGRAVVVEGPFDVWRLGPGAVCLFGAAFSPAQAAALRQLDSVSILFDSESDPAKSAEIRRQAKKLAVSLSSFGVSVRVASLKGCHDPAELSESEARSVMKDLL